MGGGFLKANTYRTKGEVARALNFVSVFWGVGCWLVQGIDGCKISAIPGKIGYGGLKEIQDGEKMKIGRI